MQLPSTLASGSRETKHGISLCGKAPAPQRFPQRDRGPAGNSNPGCSAVGTGSKELPKVMPMFAVGRVSPVAEGLGRKASCPKEGDCLARQLSLTADVS